MPVRVFNSAGASLIAPRAVLTAAHCLEQGIMTNRLPDVHVGRFVRYL